jgi:phosphoribosyl 1,2-cyclic phosphodiesterase
VWHQGLLFGPPEAAPEAPVDALGAPPAVSVAPEPDPQPAPFAPSCPPAVPTAEAPGRPPLRVVVLGSGSGGNAVVLESGSRRILLDAGFSCREIEQRMKLVGIDPRTIEALVLTHEHTDHCRGAERFARRHRLTVYATVGTLESSPLSPETAERAVVLRSGEPCEVAGFALEPFALPHDAREPIGLVIEDGLGRRVGLAADLGVRTRLAWGRMRDLDLLLLETNHDLDMLRNGPYPWPLKQRVAGRHGHLSNREAADGVPELVSARLRFVVLYHLSRTNNLPALAAAEVGEALAREGCAALLALSEQFQPTPWLEVP